MADVYGHGEADFLELESDEAGCVNLSGRQGPGGKGGRSVDGTLLTTPGTLMVTPSPKWWLKGGSGFCQRGSRREALSRPVTGTGSPDEAAPSTLTLTLRDARAIGLLRSAHSMRICSVP